MCTRPKMPDIPPPPPPIRRLEQATPTTARRSPQSGGTRGYRAPSRRGRGSNLGIPGAESQ